MLEVESTEENSDAPVYLVLGAYGAVGSALTIMLAESGGRVIVAGRDADRLSLLADAVNGTFLTVDAADFASMQECFESALSVHGRLDGVANCVGSVLLKPAHSTSESDWNSVLSVNLGSAFATVKFAARAMMGIGGSLVLVSSCAANVGLPNHEAIAAAKAGVEGLVRSAAATYSRHQIRVNCVAPGMLDTAMTRSVLSGEAQRQASAEMHPLGRIGSAKEVAVVMKWLLSEDSSWVTGQSVAVDGGISRVRGQRVQRQAASIG